MDEHAKGSSAPFKPLFDTTRFFSRNVNRLQSQFSSYQPPSFQSSPFGQHLDSVKDWTQQRRNTFHQQLDSSVQESAVVANNKGREMLKFKSSQDDWLPQRIQKAVYNKGVDVLADNSERLLRYGKGYASGVGDKMPSKTMERYHPGNIARLFTQPDQSMRYLQQRKAQLLQPWELYQSPTQFGKQKMGEAKRTFWNMHERYQELDSGNKLAHGGRAAVDYTQEKIAPVLGSSLLAFSLYHRYQQRQNTNQAMDRMFPRQTRVGKTARFLPTRMMFTKPLSRVVGNPRLSLALLTYGALTGVGQSIKDSMDLQHSAPNTFSRLKQDNREMYKSSFQRDLQSSVQNTSRTRSQSTDLTGHK
ncbi:MULTISPECIES: hypothetical protein [unclassified Agarivorans]|uniref:hypothetical protein n=1 Tax=unclassified Agarivorans TaxID=2636026 RepID=UPI003D7EF448